MERYNNDLIKETSPYLLQHAHNPVNWKPWSAEIFRQAEEEQKMILISVGYSACHWCHVMEKECFEDEEVAALMNKFFINVKVDREERPDVDTIYMKAVQLMTQRGGWPLNCFTLPNGKPIYGGTYFPKEQWMHILKSLRHTFTSDRDKTEDYANRLLEGIQQSEFISHKNSNTNFKSEQLLQQLPSWKNSFDTHNGGLGNAPKFPLPIAGEFLLDFYHFTKDSGILAQLELTLEKMAFGGIYDQVGGGFARYAVDAVWKVPHFEKMLYDNAQLISLYSRAYRVSGNPGYKRIVEQTLEWLQREMKAPDGSYFAALDADSEGVEGKYYVWTKEELQSVLQNDFSLFTEIYDHSEHSYWEDGSYIVLRIRSDGSLKAKFNWDQATLEAQIKKLNDKLLYHRMNRIPPGLDNKCITSWNALLLSGFCEAYRSFQDENYLKQAEALGQWLLSRSDTSGSLKRIHTSKKSIDGFLEDYAFSIQAFIDLYQCTLNSTYLLQAQKWTEYVIAQFSDDKSSMFCTNKKNHELIADSMDINDSVMPSSNSVMATNLVKLGRYFESDAQTDRSKQMLGNLVNDLHQYVSGYSNWSRLLYLFLNGIPELKIYAVDRETQLKLLRKTSKPFLLIDGRDEKLPINKSSNGSGTGKFIYCDIHGCQLPINDPDEIIEVLNR